MKPVYLLLAFLAAVSLARSESTSPRVIEITGDDTMKFSVTEITAKPGEALEVVFTNIGQIPRQAMAHNWVLLKPMTDDQIAALASSAAAKGPDYIPDDTSAMLAHTKTLGPKESDKIDFKAPSEPGVYPFICTFPGHFMLMRGTLTVK